MNDYDFIALTGEGGEDGSEPRRLHLYHEPNGSCIDISGCTCDQTVTCPKQEHISLSPADAVALARHILSFYGDPE